MRIFRGFHGDRNENAMVGRRPKATLIGITVSFGLLDNQRVAVTCRIAPIF
ncbi:hypothetical protein RSSM_06451 [Rhodopirellula sallentina SM41]|uniref:Uncharacterized protein n=1 Tax=Rhodopirellula sallentina SM41 TaxID=1263870 RepID=M5TSE1_9BACT|nr:hypothetical protein RSSM_06451 [Rhodopirellula sallentina SM41]